MTSTAWVILAVVVAVWIGAILFTMWPYLKPRILKKGLQYREEKVSVLVNKIEYVPEKLRYIPTWCSVFPLECPEEYNVHYIYGYGEHLLNDKNLFEKVNAGKKSFDIIVHQGYNKRGKLKYVYHTIA